MTTGIAIGVVIGEVTRDGIVLDLTGPVGSKASTVRFPTGLVTGYEYACGCAICMGPTQRGCSLDFQSLGRRSIGLVHIVVAFFSNSLAPSIVRESKDCGMLLSPLAPVAAAAASRIEIRFN